MENAVEALKMAGFMLLFIIALSITMITLTQAKTTADLVNNYSNIQFKCTKVEYHKKSKRVSYLYIEQIS